jgi:hypothetical protein
MKRFAFSNQTVPVPHNALMKPGFTRFNLSYFASDEEVDYILNAVKFIAEYGWMFLSLVRTISSLKINENFNLFFSILTIQIMLPGVHVRFHHKMRLNTIIQFW